MRQVIEGSMGVALAVNACRPKVIAAYPITPQTHIVENLSQMSADGDCEAQFLNVESEFGAASVILGAEAVGARAYSTTTAQGLLLMLEVLYNIAGLRLPVVITCANRAVSAPISIWTDHQDSVTVRDAGWIQLYTEDNQETADAHVLAYKIAEHPEVMLPFMVCMDGFILTHGFEPIELLDQKMVDDFLPPYKPEVYLTPDNPKTFGVLADPNWYAETRWRLHQAMEDARPVIREVCQDFDKTFGRDHGVFIEKYHTEDAETVIVAMGSMCGTIREVVDERRADGEKVGLLKLRFHRPFPADEIVDAVKNVKNVAVLERAVSLGGGGIVVHEIRSALYERGVYDPNVSSFIIGLGGRDITRADIHGAFEKAAKATGTGWIGLREDIIAAEVSK
jgi:pyruvate ferredoxin oxidoreductase alpha subunit